MRGAPPFSQKHLSEGGARTSFIAVDWPADERTPNQCQPYKRLKSMSCQTKRSFTCLTIKSKGPTNQTGNECFIAYAVIPSTLRPSIGLRAYRRVSAGVYQTVFLMEKFMPKLMKTAQVKKFVQVSLPAAFAESLREQADSSDRSMAAQLEHWAKIAKAIETIAPAHSIASVKTARNSSDILQALASFVTAPNVDALRSRLDSSGVASFGADPDQPGCALKYMPDGSVVRGKFDEAGNFEPNPPVCNPRSNSDATEPNQPTGRPKSVRRVPAKKEAGNNVRELSHA